MCICETIEKARPPKALSHNNNIVDVRARPYSKVIQAWLNRYARLTERQAKQAIARGGVKGLKESFRKLPRITKPNASNIKKARGDKEFERLKLELFEIMRTYGIKSFNDGITDSGREYGFEIKVSPELTAELNDELSNKVVLIMRSTAHDVRKQINDIVSQALREDRMPSNAELGRRIARSWYGPAMKAPARGSAEEQKYTADWRRSQEDIDAGGREYLFSFSRAQTIARTEVAKARNAGNAEAIKQSGIKLWSWMAYSDSRSGNRHHNRMRGKTISAEDMHGSDTSKWFKLPSGIRTPYPHWMGLPASEAVNCRCFLRPKRVSE